MTQRFDPSVNDDAIWPIEAGCVGIHIPGMGIHSGDRPPPVSGPDRVRAASYPPGASHQIVSLHRDISRWLAWINHAKLARVGISDYKNTPFED